MNVTLQVFLMCAVVMDLSTGKISNRLICWALISSIMLRILGNEAGSVATFFLNISIPVIVLYLLFQLRALGAGDIKLFSVVGAYVFTYELINIMSLAFLFGGVIGASKMAFRRVFADNYDGEIVCIHFSVAIWLAHMTHILGVYIWKS